MALEEIELVNVEGASKKVVLKPVTGEHVDRVWDKLIAAQDEAGNESLHGMRDYIKEVAQIASEISGISVEELNKYPASEKKKITDKVELTARDVIGFMKP